MTDWAKLRVVDLKDELRRRGLPYNGLKNELIARLNEADSEAVEAEDDTKDSVADDEPVANDSTPIEPEAEEPTIADTELAEDAVSQQEDEVAPPVPNKAEDTRDEEELNPEATENGVRADARSSSTVEADPKLADSVDEPMHGVEKETTESSHVYLNDTPDVASLSTPEIRETQKRKRRSLTPPPTEDAVARKRARPDKDTINGIAPKVILPEDRENPDVEMTSGKMQVDNQPEGKPSVSNADEDRDVKEVPPLEPQENQQDRMDTERDVVPPVHPDTSALYIKNFMRPLRPIDVQTHLVDLATPPGARLDNKIIVNFFLDQIRTHAFVVFNSTSAASRVRASLHDRVWPNESNRKPLWVDFVPPQQVQNWIDKEESSGRRSGARWEVVYENGADGEIEAHLESGAASFSRASKRPPPNPLVNTGDAIPSAPRGYRDGGGPPTGPRGSRPALGPGPRPPSFTPGGDSQRTKAHPVIHYQTVSDDLAQRRIDNMRSHYTSDRDRDFGREINRYSFENGDSFVDRGKEVFEGIRPPHRERAVERERRGFGGRRGGGGRRRRGGGHGFRTRSDRYQPNEAPNWDKRR